MWTLKSSLLIVVLELARANLIGYRVVNGTRAEPNEFPFMVSIRIASTGSHACGGTIINLFWVLTAAHCVAGRSSQSLNVQYGVTKISRTSPNIVNVTRVEVYERYVYQAILHDIALLRLEEPIIFSQSVRPVKLPAMYQPTAENVPATLVGWGLDQTGGTLQKKLQKVGLQIYSRQECNQRHILPIHPTNICAGVEDGGKGQCNGDSGGPLIVNDRQVGVCSWSIKPCGVSPYPGVYTEVANYIEWIFFVTAFS